MRHSHTWIPEDQILWKTIQSEVKLKLAGKSDTFRVSLWIKFILYFLLVSISYSMILVAPQTIVFIVSYIVFGCASILFAFNFAHDFSHDTVFQKHKWNNLGFIAIYTLVGAHAESWRDRHIHSHHFAPNVEHYDTDLEISNIIRVLPGSTFMWFHRYQHWYAILIYTTYSMYWVFIKDIVVLLSKKQKLNYYFSFGTQKVVYFSYLILIPILFTSHPWLLVCGAFLCMHMVQSLFLLLTFFITHHVESTMYPSVDGQGKIATSWFKNQLISSNDFYPFSRVANFLFGGFNNHIAHHLFPSLHHIYYPDLNKLLYPILQHHGFMPNQTTYWGGVRSHLRLLKKMSRM